MTLTMHPSNALVVDVKRSTDMWCVFEHHAVMKEGEPPEVIFVGVSQLVHVYRLATARTNSHWIKIFQSGGQVLVQIVATTLDKAEAFRYAQERLRDMKPMPICNVLGRNLKNARRSILCVQNQRYYNSQLDAANDLGIYASAISRHMAGHSPSAQGYTFVYADGEDA